MGKLYVSTHPLIADRLTRMRDKDTPTGDFRKYLSEITILLGYEATADLPTREVEVETPICTTTKPMLADDNIVIVPILRAGAGMVDGMLELIPFASVGWVGMARNEETHRPESYYWKMPPDIADALAIVVDPMLATGGSTIAAIDQLKGEGCTNIRLMNVVAAPEGVAAVQAAHPDIEIYVASLDDSLNENAYIVPGLGDAGDRIYGTY